MRRTRLTIDLVDTNSHPHDRQEAIGIIRGALRDRGYQSAITIDDGASDAEPPVTEERRRELLAMTPAGADVLRAGK